MLYFIFLTRKCNLKCSYCGQTSDPTDTMTEEITYSTSDLQKFILKDREPIIAFYGGEPLLNIEELKRIMDSFQSARFIIQTNGLLLNKLPAKYLRRLDSLLISIDGTEKTTNQYRGRGVYRQILENLNMVLDKGFSGDLIARMTVSANTDIYKDAQHLLFLEKPHFDHIHWQLDMIWSDKAQYGNLKSWIEAYNTGITQLVDIWMDNIKKDNLILGIVPFIGITYSLLKKTTSTLRCGAGSDAFAIHTDGSIFACPVCPEFDDFKVGSIYSSNPLELKDIMTIKSPCVECSSYSICGGRCLFTNHYNFWGEDFHLVCRTVTHLISELKRVEPEIRQLIYSKHLEIEQFNYPTFNNSCEIIP